MAFYVKYVGEVNCKNVRDFILQNALTNKKIALHPHTFDELAVDFKRTFRYGIGDPFTYLGVDILADDTSKTPIDRIRVVDSQTMISKTRIIDLPTEESYDTIYRCGYCGAITGPDGEQLPGWKLQEQINRIESNDCEVEKVIGNCCDETHLKYMTGEL